MATGKRLLEILDRKTEIRELLESEQEYNMDDIEKELRELNKEQEELEKKQKILAELEKTPPPEVRKVEETKKEKEESVFAKEEYRSAYSNFLRFGYNELSPEERSIISMGRQSASGMESRALSSLTGTAGGYTVPEGFFNDLEKAMKAYGGMREAARTISTATGNDLPMPSMDDTGNVGEIVAENAAVSSQDTTFSQIIMKAYKYSSKSILIPLELLQDSAFNIEAEIMAALAERIYRITNTHFTTGTGTNQPQGIITGATLGVTGSSATAVTFDELIDLEHSIDPAYRKLDSKFMFHDSTLRELKKMKDGDNRPLWSSGFTVSEPGTILGYPYIINNDMPELGAGKKSILFGNLNRYYIRNVMNVTMFRISEKYIENGQVGFLCFYRCDGKLRDAGAHPVKYFANKASA